MRKLFWLSDNELEELFYSLSSVFLSDPKLLRMVERERKARR